MFFWGKAVGAYPLWVFLWWPIKHEKWDHDSQKGERWPECQEAPGGSQASRVGIFPGSPEPGRHVDSPGHSGHCLCHLPPGLTHEAWIVPHCKRKGATRLEYGSCRLYIVERVERFLILFLIIRVRKGTQRMKLNLFVVKMSTPRHAAQLFPFWRLSVLHMLAICCCRVGVCDFSVCFVSVERPRRPWKCSALNLCE